MMPILWVALWSVVPLVVALSSQDSCNIHESSNLQHESPLLKSLRCYNDYETHVDCEWNEHRGRELQLWLKTDKENVQCEPNKAAEQRDASEHRMVQCRFKTQNITTLYFAIGIEHTVFFLDKKTPCSSGPRRTLDLSQHLRARTPESLSTHDEGDGGRRLSWSSPYPSSSSLNKHITYQLSYTTETQDNWTTLDVTNTSILLQRQMLIAGHRYKARVRARANVGQWSNWSPVVSWKTENDAGHFPRLHCVLDGEKEVMCSWKLSKEVAQTVSYQLACRDNQTSQSAICCVNPTVTSAHNDMLLKFSCRLTVADPENLLLELQPTRNARIFKPNKHIRPNPPQQVKVREVGSNWRVEWTAPSIASKVTLKYQVCYYRIEEKGCSDTLNVSGVSTSLSILESSLVSSQDYRVMVRSLIDPEKESMYGGIPSEWTHPVDWTSHEASLSINSLIYCSIGLLVAMVFLALYCTIPTCHRRVILWVDSVPSPGKSKILSEIKSSTSWTLMQSENTSFCKVQHLESMSTCSSNASLWPTKDTEGKILEQGKGCWTHKNLAISAEKVKGSGTSLLSFSGPYIFCQSNEPNKTSEDVKKCEEEQEAKETSSDDSVSPTPLNFTLLGEGYVGLSGRNVSCSTQDLVSHSDAVPNRYRLDSAAQDQQCPDTSPWPDQKDDQPTLSEPTSSFQPPAYTSVTFTSWPQGGAIQASGGLFNRREDF
uniref:Interleukin-3 receptor class 2 subunit beta-like n=1 Tax=Labrus bergylta TaxID=56723 RepID=A0A3Q3M0K4_9LABR